LEPIGEASGSILSPSDISFDKTEEDLETSFLRSGKKWKRVASAGRPSAPDDEGDGVVAGKRSRRPVSTYLHRFLLCTLFYFWHIVLSAASGLKSSVLMCSAWLVKASPFKLCWLCIICCIRLTRNCRGDAFESKFRQRAPVFCFWCWCVCMLQMHISMTVHIWHLWNEYNFYLFIFMPPQDQSGRWRHFLPVCFFIVHSFVRLLPNLQRRYFENDWSDFCTKWHKWSAEQGHGQWTLGIMRAKSHETEEAEVAFWTPLYRVAFLVFNYYYLFTKKWNIVSPIYVS